MSLGRLRAVLVAATIMMTLAHQFQHHHHAAFPLCIHTVKVQLEMNHHLLNNKLLGGHSLCLIYSVLLLHQP